MKYVVSSTSVHYMSSTLQLTVYFFCKSGSLIRSGYFVSYVLDARSLVLYARTFSLDGDQVGAIFFRRAQGKFLGLSKVLRQLTVPTVYLLLVS